GGGVLDVDQGRGHRAQNGKRQPQRQGVEQIDDRIDGDVGDVDVANLHRGFGLVDEPHLLEGVAELPGGAAAGDGAAAGAAGREKDVAGVVVDNGVHREAGNPDVSACAAAAVHRHVHGAGDGAVLFDGQLRR